MNLEKKVLELLKEKPMLVSELYKKLPLATSDMLSLMAFLEEYKLIETMASAEHELMAKITEKGVQLLNLPSLPEGESVKSEIGEVESIAGMVEQINEESNKRRWKSKAEKDYDAWADTLRDKKMINIYSLSQHTETANWIDAMAMRFNVSGNDVIRAMWAIAKDTVGAKLERDVKESWKTRKDRKAELDNAEFSEATINAIKTREEKRQREIAEATK